MDGFENFVPRHGFEDEFSKAGRITTMGKIDWNRPATYEDANLILRLYEERREEKLRAARAWFVGECKPQSLADWQAKCPPGSGMNANYRMVTSYWEMAASFVTSGVLHPGALHPELAGASDRLGAHPGASCRSCASSTTRRSCCAI
ncbi:MAG: hypothetical protein IPP47_22520 [Bryobacterales bacterium]|nr:hypothetical protein [Bryobacterales bacterium]